MENSNELFLQNSSLISYSEEEHSRTVIEDIKLVQLGKTSGKIDWFNTYGINYRDSFRTVIKQNGLDDFLIKLMMDDEHFTKVIELDDVLFIAVRVLKTESLEFDSEQMLFMVSPDFVWSIQEKKGDYFQWIRERLENGIGIVRKRKTDYLLFLLLESIVDNYAATFRRYAEEVLDELDALDVNPTPEFTMKVEERKQDLVKFKKASGNLREAILKLEKVEIYGKRARYFGELKEEIGNLIGDIDFELQDLESKINLIFSLQGHRLNEVMKTLTIISVIFIPLTFLAGIYGMNFKYIPELDNPNGYFILLGVMLVITGLLFWYFKRKKWF